MNYGNITYGRFTHEEWAKREKQDDPFFEEDGHIYRITETHRTPSDVRYQAVTVSEDDRERWFARRAQERDLKPSPDSSTPEGDESESDAAWTQEEEPAPKSEVDGGREESDIETGGLEGRMTTEEFERYLHAAGTEDAEEDVPVRMPARAKPDFKQFARENGWAGTGRISARIREQYEERYGPPDE